MQRVVSDPTVPSVAIVNASDGSDGITHSVEPYSGVLARSGYSVAWYQCVDYHGRPHVPEGGVTVRGLGIPLRTLDMGVNRLWVFPHRLHRIPAETVLLADPTLIGIAPSNDRVAVLVHDLRPLTRFSDRYPTRWMFRRAMPRLRQVWRILVPSASVGRQLSEFGIDPGRVRTVPETHELGYHPEHVTESLRRVADGRETRVLFVGTDREYKNIELVLQLAQRLQDRAGHRYTFTLLSRLRSATRRRIAELKLRNVRSVFGVDRVGPLYDQSDVLVFPSRYEGFGRPLIEAMAYGLPILASRIEPVVEVVGDAGILLDPDAVDAWLGALTSLEDTTTMERYARRSAERGRAYLPDRFASAMLPALRAS